MKPFTGGALRQYLAYTKRRQLESIATDRARMAQARVLFDRYYSGMAALGLHPLTRDEREHWERDLAARKKNIIETGGDTESARMTYQLLFARKK